MTISLSEYYLWREKHSSRHPWERQFINFDFYQYERKRLNELKSWYNYFRRASEGSYLDEVSYYTTPIEVSSAIKAAIAIRGNFTYTGLSALYNDAQLPLIGLFHRGTKKPPDYRLIRIIRSKKVNLINPASTILEPAIIVEEWEHLEADSIYIDVPYEKRIIQKILEENLSPDEQISKPFQLPIVSAPYVIGSAGGITLSSLSAKSAFARELVKTIQFMVPPEYRAIPPPKSVYKGKWFEYSKDIKYRVAERPPLCNSLLKGLYSRSYNPLLNELQYRYKFNGEYSIFSTLLPDKISTSQFLEEMFKNFAKTEVTLPFALDELPQMDIELTKLKKVVDEDLWLQIVHLRQYKPSLETGVDRVLLKIINQLKETLETQLSDIFPSQAGTKHRVEIHIPLIKDNLMRIAQSFARIDEKNLVSINHLKQGRDIIIDNLTKLLSECEEIRKEKERLKKRKTTGRFEILRTELINHPRQTVSEIWENVRHTGEFRDLEDLQKLLDWTHKKGYVIVDMDGRYYWIG